jgi:hypothetical protein
MSNQLKPCEVVRNRFGCWVHPVYIKRHFNIETVTFWMESSVNSDDWETMMDDCDITKWEPIAPNGFFLIDINFSEDDAYAIFARNKHNSELT